MAIGRTRYEERIHPKKLTAPTPLPFSPFPNDPYGSRRAEGWQQAFLALRSLHCLSAASLQTLARKVCCQGGGRRGLDFLLLLYQGKSREMSKSLWNCLIKKIMQNFLLTDMILLHCPKVSKSLGLFFQKPWKISALLKIHKLASLKQYEFFT